MPQWLLLSTLVWGSGFVLLLVLLFGLYVQLLYKSHLWDLRHCSTELTGKTAVVTGANSGIGKIVAQELACRGARVILACRSQERGQRALAKIQAASKSNCLVLGEVDLSSMTSVRSFARWLLQEYPEIHLLVNNAAVCGFPKTLTPEGLDFTFATNYVGPFLLTNLLQGALQRAGSARVVNVSSFRQAHGYIDEEHLTGAGRPLAFNQNYDCSKLLLTSFTTELARRLEGTGVTVNSVDPGVVYTGIMKNFSWTYRFLFWLSSFFIKPHAQEEKDDQDCSQTPSPLGPVLRASYEHEKEALTQSFQEAKAALQETIDGLTSQLEVFQAKMKRVEGSILSRDYKKHIQDYGSPSQFWEQELESLHFVVEMKNEHIHELDKRLILMETVKEKNLMLEEKITTLQQENEDLQARGRSQMVVSRQLSEDLLLARQALEKESQLLQQLRQDKEELLYRVLGTDASPTFPLASVTPTEVSFLAT